MHTVLIIEDEPDVARVITEAVERGIPGVTCKTELDFDNAIELIADLRPDAIVLDLMEGSHSIKLPGQRTWKSVWDKTFCPVVIYTGSEADLQPPVPSNHPFVRRILKGSGTVALVVKELRGFRPAIDAVRSLRTEINAVIQKVLRDTVGSGVIPTTDSTYLLHAGRRRIAASMDDPTLIGERAMTSWEQYLVPAVGESPLTADLLRRHGARWDDRSAYRLVLTPSCDMVKDRCEPSLLTACCEDMLRLAKKLSLSLSPNKLEKDVDNVIARALTAGAFAGLLPLPAFPSRFPVMVADLKRLEVIPYEAIGRTDGTQPSFERIASIDSPFREQVAWAYLTTAARPGMPERDLKAWARELVGVAAGQESTKPATGQQR